MDKEEGSEWWGWGQITMWSVGLCKDFGFYSEKNWEPLWLLGSGVI